MSLDAIVAAVRTVVVGATGVPSATCHDGLRWVAQDSDFRALFVDTTATPDVIHAWQCTRRGAPRSIESHQGLSLITHQIVVIGIYSVGDGLTGTSMASENAFRPVKDAVVAALDKNYLLGGACSNSGPPDVIAEEHRMIHGHLCHYVEIALPVEERVSHL